MKIWLFLFLEKKLKFVKIWRHWLLESLKIVVEEILIFWAKKYYAKCSFSRHLQNKTALFLAIKKIQSDEVTVVNKKGGKERKKENSFLKIWLSVQ